MWTEAMQQQLHRLISGGDAELDGGAELEVCHPDGTRAFLAPLARHCRYDPDASDEVRSCIWIRPVVAGSPVDPPGEPASVFDVAFDETRRRNLTFTDAWQDGDALVFDLEVGQRAYVRPIRSELLDTLQRWDTYYLLHLSAAEQLELDRLDSDPG